MAAGIPMELIGTGAGLLGGLAGYALREYRNQIRPFFHITEIEGTTIRRSDKVSVDDSIRDKLKGNFYIKELPPDATLANVHDQWDHADDVKRFWPDIHSKLQEVAAATTEDSLLERLREAFDLPWFEKMLLNLLVLDRIPVPPVAATSTEKLPIYDDDEKDGCVWISWPRRAKQFGNHFKLSAVEAKCRPFLNALRALDGDALRAATNSIVDVMKSEHQSALHVEQPLHKLRNENSRWVLTCYFANLSAHPVVVHQEASLLIRDPKTGRFAEDCYLALVQEGSINDTDTPVVVKAGGDTSLCFITRKIQKDMQYGTAIRESYERTQARCSIRATISRVGFFKTQKVASARRPFRA